MIELISLRNFRSWDRLDLELEQITTLVGPNGAGKTNVIRALYWLTFGRPLGAKFLTHGKDSATVGIYLDGDRRIERRLAKGSSAYRIDGSKILKAFGTEVPDEVRELLRLTPVNFQRQLDAPFWMMESPGQAAKNLNGIVNLDLIDMAMSEVGSRVKKTIATSQNVTQREETLSAEVEALSWVEEFDADLSRIEQLEEKLKQVEEELISLRMDAENVSRCQNRRDKLKQIVHNDDMISDLDEIGIIDVEIVALGTKLNQLQKDYVRASQLETEADSIAADVESAEMELNQATKGRCPLCSRKLPSQSAVPTCISPSTRPSLARASRTGKKQCGDH